MSKSCCNPCDSINTVNKSISSLNNAVNILVKQQQDTINIINGGGVTPGGPVPDNLALHVSTLGNDLTGNGSLGNPYQTLQRAIKDVYESGWNETAEIRILSTGGIFQFPQNLNIEVGGRGLQKAPLIIRGFNTNPNPGRTTILSQTVLAGSFDSRSQIVDINALGPFTSAQLGQYIRFTSGAYASFPSVLSFPGFLGNVEVNVPIVNIAGPNNIKIAFASTTIPAPGDSFVIESLDTIINVPTFSAIRSIDRVVFEDIVFTSPAGGFANVFGLGLQGGSFFDLRAVNIVTSGLFLLNVFDGTTVVAGNVLTDIGANAYKPTTKSLFVNIGAGGFFTTRILDSPEYAPISIKYGGFLGGGQLSFNGSIAQSYIDTMQVRTAVGIGSIQNSWILNTSTTIGSVGVAQLNSVHFSNGIFNILDSSRLTYNGITLENANMFIDESNVDGQDTLTIGTPSAGSWISVNASKFCHRDNLSLQSNSSSDGLILTGGAELCLVGNIIASNFTGGARSGIVMDSSRLIVQGDVTCDNNNSNGLSVIRSSEIIISGNLSTQGNQTGINLGGSRLLVGFQLIASNNTFSGLFVNGDSFVSAFLLNALNNTSGNIDIILGAQIVADTINATGNASLGCIQVRNSSSIIARVLTAGNSIGGSLSIDNNSSVGISQDLNCANSTPAFGGAIAVLRGSRLIVANNIISNNNNGSGCFISESSVLDANSMTFSNNSINGISINRNSNAKTNTITASDNSGGSGIVVDINSSFTAISTADLSANAIDGFIITNRSVAFINQLISSTGNNGNFGAQILTGSKLHAPILNSVSGTLGDVVVGVNAVTTWGNIATGNPTFITDYLSGQNPTQLCEISR